MTVYDLIVSDIEWNLEPGQHLDLPHRCCHTALARDEDQAKAMAVELTMDITGEEIRQCHVIATPTNLRTYGGGE